MQDLLAAAIIATTILFTLSAIADFAAGLIKLWQDAGSKAQPQVEPASIEQMEVEEIIVSEIEPAPAAQKIATLDWVERNLPRAEVYATELPCAIGMAKARSPKASPAPVLQLATRQQLINVGIRRCKKLASQLKVRRYNTMRLSELADVLVGLVALNDLVA